MSESSSDIATSPGLILRAARDELSYTVDYVANELHLRASVVQSLEDEDYDSFKSDVFLKGYFRSYCRLVNLHEGRMVELLDAQLKLRENHLKAIDQETKQAKQARRNKKLGSMFAASVVVVAVILLFGEMNTGSDDSLPKGHVKEIASQASLNSEQVESQQSTNTLIENSESVDSPESSIEITESRETGPKTEVDEIESVAPASVTVKVLEEPTQLETGQSIVQPPAKQVSTALNQETTTEAAPQELQVSATVKGTFAAEFEGDCWFTLKDASGKTVFAALKRQGQTVDFEGSTPFHIVLGDAKVASIRFNGQDVDLAPFTRRNGRAELTLGTE